MKDTTAQTQKPRALFRAWQATVTFREVDVVTDVQTYTVTMSRTASGVLATVDGQEVATERAARILAMSDRLEVTAEILEDTAPTIGKPAACDLHKELGRLRFRDHYTVASEALGRTVASLATLTASEAHTVRSYAYGQWGMTA